MPSLPKPSKDELQALYVVQGLSVYKIARHLKVSDATVKTWLLSYGLFNEEKALKNMRNPSPPTRASTELVPLVEPDIEVVTYLTEFDDDGGRGSALDQADGEDETDTSSFGRLSPRMQRAALIYADVQGDAAFDSDFKKAEKIGVEPETLYRYLKHPDFREAVIELQSQEARFIVRYRHNRSLVRLLESGELSSKDRENIMRWLNELGPDTQINFNQFNGTGKDGRIRSF